MTKPTAIAKLTAMAKPTAMAEPTALTKPAADNENNSTMTKLTLKKQQPGNQQQWGQ